MNWIEKLNEELTPIINYQFNTWFGDLVFPFWVSDYQETMFSSEQGYHEYVVTLTGTNKGSFLDLEKDRQKIEQLFTNYTYTEEGYGLAILYDNSIMIPSVDEQITRLEIHLNVKEWRV